MRSFSLLCYPYVCLLKCDDRFSELGRAYIPQLRHIVHHYDFLEAAGHIPAEVKHSIVSTLVASSFLSSIPWKVDAVERAAKIAATLLIPDEYLDMMVLARKTDVCRLQGSLCDDNPLSGFSTDNKKLNALSGEVLLILSADWLQNKENLDMAGLILQKIQPVDPTQISTLEELVLQKKAFAWGRLCRFQGRFEESRQVLEALYNARHFPEGVISVGASCYDLVSHLAAVLCELGDPVYAEMLVSDKLDDIHNLKAQKSPPALRLRLALAEAALQQGEYWRAQDIYWDLTRHVGISQVAYNSTMDICRLNIGLARVQHVQGNWIAALKHWERALWVYVNHPGFQGFGTVIVYASIGFVKRQMGDAHNADRYLAKAQELFQVTGRQHWFTGLGTKWLDQVMPVDD